MRHIAGAVWRALALVLCGPLLLLILAAMPAMGQEAATPQAAVVKVCTGCHTMQIVMDTPRDYDAWHDTVQKMLDRGASGSQDELGLVMDFLFQNMTTIDVNHADAEALTVVLHAPQTVADAIIARRTSHPFKDLADLEVAVPGLDKSLLESKKRMIFFQ